MRIDQINYPYDSKAMSRYLAAKSEFDILDALSRKRALTNDESLALERCMKRMDEWGSMKA